MSDLFFEKTYSPLSSAEIIAREQNNMTADRFEHCVGVSQTAVRLAELNHYDQEKRLWPALFTIMPSRFLFLNTVK